MENILNKVELYKEDLIIDIASNDGTLLSSYPAKMGLRLVGIDPTSEKFKKYYPDREILIQSPNYYLYKFASNYYGLKLKELMPEINKKNILLSLYPY